MKDTVAYQRLYSITNKQAEELAADLDHAAEVAYVQELIDNNTHWHDPYYSKLAAGYIACGMCHPRHRG